MERRPFSEMLKKGLELRNMKAVQLHELTGISKSRISQYLKGSFEAKQDSIYLIAKALDVSEAWLMGYDVPYYRLSLDIKVSEHEKNLLDAYRNQPEMQKAVDRLLGVTEQPPQILQTKQPRQQVFEVDYVARDFSGNPTTGKLKVTDEDLIKAETDDYSKYD